MCDDNFQASDKEVQSYYFVCKTIYVHILGTVGIVRYVDGILHTFTWSFLKRVRWGGDQVELRRKDLFSGRIKDAATEDLQKS